MNENVVVGLTEEWSELSDQAVRIEKVPMDKMLRLLKETYEVLSFYHRFGLVPKEVAGLLLEMDHYRYFSTLMKEEHEPEDFPYYQAVNCMVSAMEEGFLKGSYEHAFPRLKVYDPLTENSCVVDLVNGSIEELIQKIQR